MAAAPRGNAAAIWAPVAVLPLLVAAAILAVPPSVLRTARLAAPLASGLAYRKTVEYGCNSRLSHLS